MEQLEPIVAIATPPGNGAIGIIRLSGRESLEIVNGILNKRVDKEKRNRAVFRKVKENGKVIEHAVIIYYASPKSYTGEDVVELSVHGNMILMEKIVNILLKDKRLRPALPGEFTQRAFLNGKLDLTQAEAVAEVIAAGSISAATLSMKHLEGDVKTYLQSIKSQLIDAVSLLELELDFSQEDLELIEKNKLVKLLEQINEKIANTLEIYNSRKFLTKGIDVVLYGKPNVGKSSLLNALIGKERAIVSSVPGTTRDYIESTVNYKGININFIDTAGLRTGGDEVEKIGMEYSLKKVKEADINIVIVDGASALDNSDFEMLSILREKKQGIIVINKSDLPENSKTVEELRRQREKTKMIKVSAKEKKNIERIKEEIYSLYAATIEQSESEIIIANERQYNILKNTKENIVNAVKGIKDGLPAEMIAFDLREAVRLIGSITGEITDDDILNNIFGSFCIGK